MTTRKQLTLSPEAIELLRLPLKCDAYNLRDADGRFVGMIDYYGDNALDTELAALIVDALNEMLTPVPQGA